ncbi:Mur ligase family protein [Spiroplasma endosymbiont of Labia minor]|uniref:Mur ligase family protein n=1 Tax=Spiroplasma endosymbiont of Labia minor TaxID=3066305 RepID=UPI0030CB886A
MISVNKEIIPVLKRFANEYNLNKVLTRDNLNNSFDVINIVGTNGKGSTSFYLSQGLKTSFNKVGLFLSPAFIYHNERIQINNEPISDLDLLRIIKQIDDDIIQFNLTFFEIWTLIAAIYFKENNIDIAILEAGIGGVLDSTNLFSRQVLTCLTSVSLDHQEILGNTVEEIIMQKIGIVKFQKPIIISMDNYEYYDLIRYKLRTITNKIYLANICSEDYIFQKGNKGLVKEALIFFKINNFECLNLAPPLGRMTVLQSKPLLVIDGAHNVNAIEKLTIQFKDTENLNVICGFSKEKDTSKMYKILTNNFKNVTRISFNHIKAETGNYPNWEIVLQKLMNENENVLICGSLYFIPQVYEWYIKG